MRIRPPAQELIVNFVGNCFVDSGQGSRKKRKSPRAFTLIELVISSSLMTLILVSSYLCLSSGVSSRKLIESRAEAVQSARVALAIMSADLRGACPISRDIAFLGMQRMLGDVESDNLDFATRTY